MLKPPNRFDMDYVSGVSVCCYVIVRINVTYLEAIITLHHLLHITKDCNLKEALCIVT